MFNYKIDVLKELSKHGYTSTRMRKEKIMSEATMQNLRKGKGITTVVIPCYHLVWYNREHKSPRTTGIRGDFI